MAPNRLERRKAPDMEPNPPLDILKQALLLEKRGHALYTNAAQNARHPAVQEFFAHMAEEEKRHIEMISAQLCAFAANECFLHEEHLAPPDDEEAHSLLDAALEARINAAGFQAAAIQAAIAMEKQALRLYSDRAAAATDPEERRLYTYLSEWERGHLNALLDLDRSLLESVWHDNQFWPF